MVNITFTSSQARNSNCSHHCSKAAFITKHITMATTLSITTTMTSCYRRNDPHNGHGNNLYCRHGNNIYLFIFYLFLEWRDLLMVMFFKRVQLLRWLETTQGRHGEIQQHNDHVWKQKHTHVAKVTPTADTTTVYYTAHGKCSEVFCFDKYLHDTQ